MFFSGKQKNMFSRTLMNVFYYIAFALYLKCSKVCFLYKSTLPVSRAHLQTDITGRTNDPCVTGDPLTA